MGIIIAIRNVAARWYGRHKQVMFCFYSKYIMHMWSSGYGYTWILNLLNGICSIAHVASRPEGKKRKDREEGRKGRGRVWHTVAHDSKLLRCCFSRSKYRGRKKRGFKFHFCQLRESTTTTDTSREIQSRLFMPHRIASAKSIRTMTVCFTNGLVHPFPLLSHQPLSLW